MYSTKINVELDLINGVSEFTDFNYKKYARELFQSGKKHKLVMMKDSIHW